MRGRVNSKMESRAREPKREESGNPEGRGGAWDPRREESGNPE